MFFRKKKYTASGSLSRLAWMRFLRNKTGVAALIVILLTVVIAMLGYLITPDQTPFANTHILEIGTQKPGFQVNMLRVRKNEPEIPVSWFQKMISGAPESFLYIPVEGQPVYKEDHVTVKVFDADHMGPDRTFSLPDVIYPLAPGATRFDGEQMYFKLINGEELAETIAVLREKTESQFIKKRYLLGTDQFGRDLLSRLIIGTRVSISVGFISVAISLIVGIFFGAVSGFFRGFADDIIMWFINVVWSIPTLLLVIAITFALGRGFWQVFVAVGLTMWVEVARVVRGQIISIREKEFVEAGFALGFSNFRIIMKHILPNILSPVIVISAANFAAAILIEAGLSFLGIGVQPPMPSWGSMIKEYYSFILLDSAYLAFIPGVAIILLVMAFMLLGNALRDALDVKVETN